MEQLEAKRRGLDERIDLGKEVNVLQAEVTVMRRSLEANLERWDTYQGPNYNKEFGMVKQSIDKLKERLASVERTPIVANPDKILQSIEEVSEGYLQESIVALDEARRQYDEGLSQLKKAQARTRGIANILVVAVSTMALAYVVAVLNKWIF